MSYDSLDPVDDSFIKDYENFQSKTCELDRKLGAVLGKSYYFFVFKNFPVKFVLPKLSRKIVVKNLVLDLNSTFVNYVIKHLRVLSCNSFVGYEPPKFVPNVFFNQILFTFFQLPKTSFNWENVCGSTNRKFISDSWYLVKKFWRYTKFWWFGSHELVNCQQNAYFSK